MVVVPSTVPLAAHRVVPLAAETYSLLEETCRVPGAFDDPRFVELIAKLVAMLGASDVEAATALRLIQRQLSSKRLNFTDLAIFLQNGGAGAASAQLARALQKAIADRDEAQRQFESLVSRGRMLEEELRRARGEREEAVLSRDKLGQELAAVLAEIQRLREKPESDLRYQLETVMKAEQGSVRWGWGDNMDQSPKDWDIEFKMEFSQKPIVQLSIQLIDVGTSDGWTRLGIEALDVDNRRMKIRVNNWSDLNRVAGLIISWLALGD
jgi:hypothetical protein